MPDPKQQIDAAMQRAYAKVAGEMPDVKPISVSPPSFPMSLLLPSGADAITNPFTGNVTYNPARLQGQDSDYLEQVMAHELTHTRQTQNTPWYQKITSLFSPDARVPAGVRPGSVLDDPYHWRSNEMEAFQAERNRRPDALVDPVLGTRDIQLRKESPGAGSMAALRNGLAR